MPWRLIQASCFALYVPTRTAEAVAQAAQEAAAEEAGAAKEVAAEEVIPVPAATDKAPIAAEAVQGSLF